MGYHPAKFGGYRHCGSGDIMFLVVSSKQEDSISSLKSTITVYL